MTVRAQSEGPRRAASRPLPRSGPSTETESGILSQPGPVCGDVQGASRNTKRGTASPVEAQNTTRRSRAARGRSRVTDRGGSTGNIDRTARPEHRSHRRRVAIGPHVLPARVRRRDGGRQQESVHKNCHHVAHTRPHCDEDRERPVLPSVGDP